MATIAYETARDTSSQLGPDDLIRMYRTMFLSRRVDDREIMLKQQQKTFAQFSGAGHEAIGVAAGNLLSTERDCFFPYYRDRGLVLALGVPPLAIFLEAIGARNAPYSGGRAMPNHWGDRSLNIVSQSSPTGTQWVQAVGAAEAAVYLDAHPSAKQKGPGRAQPDSIVYVSGGEGSTSEGEFWESLGAACLKRAPVLYVIQDNQYAISVPVEFETAGGSISALVRSYPSLAVFACDGTDPIESHRVLAAAADHCRKRLGPALVHASVIRRYSHSNSDDQRQYRSEEELAADNSRDPIPRFRDFLLSAGIIDSVGLERLHREVDAELDRAVDEALAAEAPRPAEVMTHIYSEAVDPVSSAFDSPPVPSGDPKTMVELINRCIADEMHRDERVLIFGQDVADCSRERNLDRVGGKGGVFKATAGLQRKFGSDRAFNAPITEAAIVGRALGMALRGLKPVVEIQFFDYIWPAVMQIRDELANFRWRSKGNFSCPIVIRTPIGGYLGGGAIYHSQSGECIFTHLPGLRVVMPSTAEDANGLLRTAIRCDDPVLFLEPKHLYRQGHNKSPYPGPNHMIPFGRARIRRTGSDLTIVTYGSTVHRGMLAATQLEKEDNLTVEVIDLRSLNPYDWEAIAASVRKTNRVLVVHEDWKSWGYGAEIAARIGQELFDSLDAPVIRVAGKDTFCPYHPALEDSVLPQVADVVAAARTAVRY